MKQPHQIQKGKPYPLGATLEKNGVNFSIFSPEATQVDLLLFTSIDDTQPIIIQLDKSIHKSFYYWHIFIENIGVNQLYAYRINGEFNPEIGRLFDYSKVLVDPYAKAIVGKTNRKKASNFGQDTIENCYKSAVISDDFDWQGVENPKFELNDAVIYEMHVGGFTKNKNSGLSDQLRGTYLGVIEKIPYLKELGINTVELMPVYAFDFEDAPADRINYWGYSPINFFAPHAGFSTSINPQEIIIEFKTMIRELHRNGIEVILDVVYNHTAEADLSGPTYCMKGISNYSYYLVDSHGNYLDYSGCGNTINANHSVVRRMIANSLEYWVKEMHIDGFRFDLASILSRGENGEPLPIPPVLWSIESNPILAKTKLIAEPWDAKGLFQVSNFIGDKWAIWNAHYRDDIRRYIKGDGGMIQALASRILGSKEVFSQKNRYYPFLPDRSIHFITCHDGFTLYDLVSYNEKHNEENGENNRDGHNHNESWNCGVEGETIDTEINRLREQQIRNFITLLFLSQGTPMMLMGDEVKRTQNGNNNAYCHDNELAWFNWDDVETNKTTFQFTQTVIQLAKTFKIFNHEQYLNTHDIKDQPYVIWHGLQLNNPDWSYISRTLAAELINPHTQEAFFIMLNMYWEDLDFELPHYNWEKHIDTSVAQQVTESFQATSYKVHARSIVVLRKMN